MKNLIIILVLSLLLIGCAETAPKSTSKPTTTMPDIKQVSPVTEEPAADTTKTEIPETKVTVKAPETKTPETKAAENKTKKAEPAIPTKTETVITINSDLKLDKSEITVKLGDSIKFKNNDKSPHIILIDRIVDRDRLVRGDRLESGDTWSYTFNEKGDFTAHGIFTSRIWLKIKVI